jgi:hypothetical protein
VDEGHSRHRPTRESKTTERDVDADDESACRKVAGDLLASPTTKVQEPRPVCRHLFQRNVEVGTLRAARRDSAPSGVGRSDGVVATLNGLRGITSHSESVVTGQTVGRGARLELAQR